MGKSESKYFNTAKRMDDAFFELIEKKSFEFITIKEICAKAKVNRSTFYLHYETINDLLMECIETTQHELIKKTQANTISISSHIQNAPLDEIYFISEKYLEPYLSFIKEKKQIFKTILKHPEIFQAVNTYEIMYQDIFVPILKRFHVPEEDQPYIMSFYLEGIIGVINNWLKNDCKDSIEHITTIIQGCVQRPRGNL